MRSLFCTLFLFLPAAAAAQDTVIVIRPDSAALGFDTPELPRAVADEAIRWYNAPGTARLTGHVTLPRGSVWRGDVAVRGGPVELAGRLEGSLLVVNGDAVLAPAAVITGSLLVVGGTVRGADSALVGAGVRMFRELLWYRLEGDTIVYAPTLRRRLRVLGARRTWSAGDTRVSLTLATAGTYNRIEGLPVVFGPSFDWQLYRNGRLRLDALGTFRTGGNLGDTRSDLGYLLRAELLLGGSAGLGFGVRAYDQIRPIEDWQLRDSEVGWGAFLFHRDYRDYYRARGVAARIFTQPVHAVRLGLELRRDRQGSELTNDPISLFRNRQAWRPNPPVDDGHFTTVAATALYDTRNDRWDPTAGWLVRGTVEVSGSEDIVPHPGVPAVVRDSISPAGYRFTWLWLDARRYLRLTQGNRMSIRVVGGGWLGGDPLPLQRRVSLGGPDPLPGYGFRYLTCGAAITDSAFLGTVPAVCDRALLAQVEFRGHVALRWAYDPERDTATPPLLAAWIEGLDVVVFAEGGQAWLTGRGPGRFPTDRLPALRNWIADLGVGLDWGGFGIYVSKAVTAEEPVRVVFRLDHRF